MLKCFFGHDARVEAGTTAFVRSVIAHASRPVALVPITRRAFAGQPEGTNAFTFRRFLVPSMMSYRGWAIFADGADMVVRADIHELWSRGIAEGDREKVQAAQDMLRTWNEKNRETPIRPNLQSIQQRVRAMRMSSAERLVRATPKEMRGMVSANLVAD